MRRGVVLFLCLSLCLFLGACAERVPLTRPLRVEVPVPSACSARSVPEPDWPVRALPERASSYEILRALAVENELRKGYEVRLVAVLEACRQ